MTSDTLEPTHVTDAIESLRREVAGLGKRLAELENAVRRPPVSAPAASAEISDELIVVISAAVAAYLGVKPRIRQIRIISSAYWAQHGRATIQASHSISLHPG